MSEVEMRGDGDAYLEPVCLHGVISKAVPEEANQIKRKENVHTCETCTGTMTDGKIKCKNGDMMT